MLKTLEHFTAQKLLFFVNSDSFHLTPFISKDKVIVKRVDCSEKDQSAKHSIYLLTFLYYEKGAGKHLTCDCYFESSTCYMLLHCKTLSVQYNNNTVN